jgi:hypothetical protein
MIAFDMAYSAPVSASPAIVTIVAAATPSPAPAPLFALHVAAHRAAAPAPAPAPARTPPVRPVRPGNTGKPDPLSIINAAG